MRSRNSVNVDGRLDAVIVVVGEDAYAEYQGDRPAGVVLPLEDRALLERASALDVPTVVVVVSGRPIDLHGAEQWAGAGGAAGLPGTEGAGVAGVLFGLVPPSGTLPMTWPTDPDQQPINVGDGQVPLFEFGHGAVGW